jgi:glycosyltransferase involved in cell wall biosynthesis
MVKHIHTILVFFLSITHTIINGASAHTSSSEHPIVVVVCSYNNSQWSKNTLQSIFDQNYENFRVIIVDDCSTDNNVEVIQAFIDDNCLADRVTFIKNDKRHRKLFNLYHVLYQCNDDEIVFMVDGDDSIAHSDVFARINNVYEDENVWFTYGQYRNEPASEAIAWGHKEMGYCRPVPKHIQRKQAYRYYSFIYMHPRSFRAWLFKLVKLEDLIADKIEGFEGDFYPASNDVAMYFPMVEMAHTHIRFIPEILYIRNLHSDIVGFKVDRKIQTSSAREIRKKGCYSVLFQSKKHRLKHFENMPADMFLLCCSQLNEIESVLKNIQTKCTNLDTIYLFFQNTIENKKICRFIKKNLTNVIFVPYDLNGNKTLKNRLLDYISVIKNDHIFVITDACSIEKNIHLSDHILWLEKTFAYRFYLNRNNQQTTFRRIPLTDTIYAWKNNSGIDSWKNISPITDSFICRKKTLYEEIKKSYFNTMYSFLKELQHMSTEPTYLGLFSK